MQARMQRNAIRHLSFLVYASLCGFALLLGGCGAQKADTKTAPDRDDSAVATSQEAVDVESVEHEGGDDEVPAGTAPDVLANPRHKVILPGCRPLRT